MARVLRITDANTRRVSNAVFDNWTSGAPDNWTATGSPTASQVVSEGTIQTFASAYALDIQNASTAAVRGYYQDVTDLTEGQTYYIQCYVKPTTGKVRLYAWDGGGTSNPVYVESSTDTEWQELIVEKVAGSGGIRIGLIAFDASSRAVFDLVQIATFSIEFIEGVYSSFFRVTNWEIQVPDYKGSGVYASSPVAEGRKLIDGYWDNVTQTISFYLRGDADTDITTQNAAAEKLGELLQALQAARDFNKTSWVRDPVYMQFKAENETMYRYALIANARIPQLADMYSIEFAQLVMKDLDLIVEHPVAFGMPPGEGAPVLSGVRTTYNSQDYGNYDDSGVAEDTAEYVFLGNSHNQRNITNMHIGTAGANLIGGALPRNVAASNTATYFGINTSLSGSGQFHNIIYHVSRVAVGSVTGDWQYWNGSTWTSIGTLADIDSSNGFTVLGTHFLNFTITSVWSTNSPGGALPTGYWLRYLATGTYSTVPQIDLEVYTTSRNYIEFPLNAVEGNIAALAGMYARNMEGEPFQADRVLIGLRSVDRGADFQPIINLGGQQNDSDISITYDTGVSAVQDYDVDKSTGYVARSTAASEKYVEIEISGDLAQQYIGEFRCFLTMYKHEDATTQAWIAYKSLEGMPFEVNEKAEWDTWGGTWGTDKIPVFDLGQMIIDLDMFGGLLPDTIIIRIYTDTDTTDNLDRCSLVFVPVDEYHFDASREVPLSNTASRWVGYDTDLARVGSVEFARSMSRTNFLIALAANPRETKMRYIPKSNGPMILQTGAKQRLYLFLITEIFYVDGSGNILDSIWCYNAHTFTTARFLANPRYLGMRGSQ